MKRLNFNTYCDFSIEAYNRLLNNGHKDFMDMSIIAKYSEAKEIIKSLLNFGLDLRSVEIHDEEWDGYCDEYIISVCNIETEPELWCEPMLRENGYLNDDSDFIYVLDNCSSKVLSHLKSKHVYEVSIDEEEMCDGDCENCEYNNELPNEPDAVPKSTYVVNVKQVDKDIYLKELERFENRYTEIIRRNVSDFCEFVDEMNEFRKLFSW